MVQRVVVVGASRGIGLALVRQLHARGDEVIATCRRPSSELAALGVEVVDGVDVTTEAGIARLCSGLGTRDIHVLIHNAGVLSRETMDDLSIDRIRRQFEVNALAPLRTIVALRSRLSPGAKVGILTSRMGSIEDNTSGSMYGGRCEPTFLRTYRSGRTNPPRPRASPETSPNCSCESLA